MRNTYSLLRNHTRRLPRHAAQAFSAAAIFMLLLAPFSAGSAAAQQRKGEKPAATTAAAAAPLPWPRYGIDITLNTGALALNTARDSGATAVRLYVAWSSVEPTNTTPNNYSWASLDTKLSAIAASGLETLVIIDSCPTWACDNVQGPINKVPVAEMAQFAAAMAARYSPAPYNVHRWEFWNEPDSTYGVGGNFGWGRHGVDYAAMVAAAVPAMKAVDPLTTISTGGLGYDWFTIDNPPGPFYKNFLPEVLQAGAGQYFDYLAFHYYAKNIHWTRLADKAAELRQLAQTNGFTKPLVINETGLTSSSDTRWSTPAWGPNSTETQARYLVQASAQAHGAGIPGIFWFTISDYPEDGVFDAFTQAGLITTSGEKKPSFYAYQTVKQELGDGAFIRQATSTEFGNSKVEAYLFEGNGHKVWVIWANSNSVVNVTMPSADVARIRSMYGQDVPYTSANSNVAITLTQNPIFVEAPRFIDVPGDFFVYDSIEYLAARGIISGYDLAGGVREFRPFNNTTRGQLTKIITIGMGWNIDTTGAPHFLDVAATNPFYGTIETAYNHGVISGYDVPGGKEFRWGNNVTRGQLSKIIVLAKGWAENTAGGPHFLDVPTNSPFYGVIETAYNKGIISGYDVIGGREFRFGNNATRAQIAKIANLALVQP